MIFVSFCPLLSGYFCPVIINRFKDEKNNFISSNGIAIWRECDSGAGNQYKI